MPGWNPFEFLFKSPRYVTVDSSELRDFQRVQSTAHRLQLDPITVAGCFDASLVPPSEADWFEKARALLINERPPIASGKTRARRTRIEYKAHLTALEQYKVVSRQSRGFAAEFICAYFAVPKKDETARSIFNGGVLTEFTIRMPSVNIPDALYIAKLIAAMAKKFKGAIQISVMDLRHWFHQIRIPPSWRPFFTICVQDLLFTWNVLPMGWTASPYIAQAMALGVIVVMMKINHGIEFKGAHQSTIPHHLISECGNIAITCNYDNICVIASTSFRNVGEWVKSALQTQSIAIKEFTHVDAANFRKGEKIAHLSVLFGQRPSDALITTQHVEESIKKWRIILERSRESWFIKKLTKREVARVVGILLYDQRLGGKQLHHQTLLINTLTALHPVTKWDELWVGDEHVINSIFKRFETMLQNPPRVVMVNPPPEKELIVASDACPKGAGHVIKWMNADPIDIQQYKSSVPESVHIFVHEMVAAYVAIDAACKLVPKSDQSKTTVYFLIDNAAVAGAVAKGITTVRAVQGVLSKICTCLGKFNSYVVRNIPGKWNAADGPSRGKPPEHINLMELFARDEIHLHAGGMGRKVKEGSKVEPIEAIELSEPVEAIEAQLALMDSVEDIYELGTVACNDDTDFGQPPQEDI